MLANAPRFSYGETDVDTAVLRLSPELLAALRRIAPKQRRSKARYILALALIGAAVSGSRIQPLRDYLLARWHGVIAHTRASFTTVEASLVKASLAAPARIAPAAASPTASDIPVIPATELRVLGNPSGKTDRKTDRRTRRGKAADARR
jgi:hypothetical protein